MTRLATKSLVLLLLVIAVTEANDKANAQQVCIEKYFAQRSSAPLGIQTSDITNIVAQISSKFGQPMDGLNIVPCDSTRDAQSVYLSDPLGNYILYNPIWARQMLGRDVTNQASRAKAIFIFGHELEHIFHQDWTANAQMRTLDKEVNADKFGGCASAALGVSWDQVVSVIGDLRGDIDTDHPSFENSQKAAKEGFDNCSPSLVGEKQRLEPPPNHPVPVTLNEAPSPNKAPSRDETAIGYRFCNKSSERVGIATAGLEPSDARPSSYAVSGWTTLGPNRCATIISYPRDSKFYWYADSPEGVWSGGVPFCVGTEIGAFAGFNTPGELSELLKTPCDARRVRGFIQDTGAPTKSVRIITLSGAPG